MRRLTAQHHYGLTKSEARDDLCTVLRGGLVVPLNGRTIFTILEKASGAGLLDRLIADDYARADMETLTLDRKMAALPGARRLR